MITIQGKGVSAGVGVGPLYYYRRATAEIKRYTVEDTDAEWHRFKGAQTGAVVQLGQLAEQARAEAGDKECAGFKDFHARRLVETAGHIIISYLLARQAGESEEYAPSARIFSKLAEGKIAEAYTYVMNSPTEDVGLFRDVERQE